MTGSKLEISQHKTNLLQEISEIMEVLFDFPAEEITLTTSMNDLDLWDSIQHLNLVLMIEERYDVNFSPKEIEGMTDVNKIVAVLQIKVS